MCERFATTEELLAYLRRCTDDMRSELAGAAEASGAGEAEAQAGRRPAAEALEAA
jgi:hypothetical protein